MYRTASTARAAWPVIALGGAVCLAAAYLSDALSGLALALYYSVVGLPLLGLLMILPTVLALGALAWLAARLVPWPWAIALACAPLAVWSVGYVPAEQARLLEIAEGDGGGLPEFAETDVLAIVDRTAPRHASKTDCTATCVEILRHGPLRAIFLPRFQAPDSDQIAGVIYRKTTHGPKCHRELAPHGVRPLCVSVQTATLWDVTHVLESYYLPPGDPAELGVHGGEQVRLIHRYSGDVLLQRTKLTARVPSRAPLFGDLDLSPDDAAVRQRMMTKRITRDWEHPPLITMLHTALERQQRGLE
ncbi:MAG: hypothetical protein AAGI10_13135 [Pseudomonadota bacterium]